MHQFISDGTGKGKVHSWSIMKEFLSFLFLIIVLSVEAKTFYDVESDDLHLLFQKGKGKYIIRYHHHFVDTLTIPYGCELYFKGGSLSGPIKFCNTKLCGDVNLKGSSISGTVKNGTFNASWLCAMDGMTDDAQCINEMISVCSHVVFQKGLYRLVSMYSVNDQVTKEYASSIKAHIGICRSNLTLTGEDGAVFLTEKPLGTICIFSKPNQIDNSIGNITISGLTFTVCNDGKEFHEFMHTIKLIGVNGMTIKNCKFNDFWGDAICLSHYGDTPETGERTRNQNVKILNNAIIGGDHHNNRNGISIVSGKDVLIKGNTIKNTSRKDMPGGIDVEPNNSAYTIDNIRILDNVLDNIRGGGGAIGLCTFNNGPASNIYIERNRISRSIKGIQLNIKTENITYNIYIRNNIVSDDTKPYNFMGKGKIRNLVVTDNLFGKAISQEIPGDLVVNKLTVKRNFKKKQGS